MVSSLLNILLIFLQDYPPTTAETICVLSTTGLLCIGASYYVAGVFPFAADQLIGTSGELFSFAVYWMAWGLFISSLTIELRSISTDSFVIVVEAVSFLSLLMMDFTVTSKTYSQFYLI